jgi:hypothetical protein
MNEKSLITKLWERKDILLLAGLAILCMLLFKQCGDAADLKKELEIQSMNLDALKDSVRVQKNKLGEDVYVKKTLLATKENLEKLNKDLAKELDVMKGKVITIQKIAAKTKVDTQYVPTYVTIHEGGEHSLDWKFDTTFSVGNYRKFSGNSFFRIDTINHKIIPGKTRINQDEMGFSFVTGIREKDKALEIFVTPKYPGMVITDIEGAIIDPHKSEVLKSMFPNKRWSVGPYAGVGMSAGVGFNGQPIAGPTFNIGVALQWSWFKF